MNIRFLDSQDTIYDVVLEHIDMDVIQISGQNLPEDNVSGFDVVDYTSENELYVVESYPDYTVVYDSGEDYVQFTSDTNTYYNYLIYDETSRFVKDIEVRVDQEVINGYGLQSGQGKKYREFSYELFDEYGFYLYKVVDGELVKTIEDERIAFLAGKKHTLDFETTKESKLVEINLACNHYIEEGIDYNGSHYSYTNDDQKNIATLMKFMETTNLSVPYHADGESCRAYSVDEFTAIFALQNYNLMHHTSYANQLKLYVNSLTTVDAINNVQYGQELTGEYLNTYNEMIGMTKAIAEQYLGAAVANI